jgi:hypothetical protein
MLGACEVLPDLIGGNADWNNRLEATMNYYPHFLSGETLPFMETVRLETSLKMTFQHDGALPVKTVAEFATVKLSTSHKV